MQNTETIGFDTALSLCGQTVNIHSMDHLITQVSHKLEAKASFFVCTLNLDHLVKLQSNFRFREAYRMASLITADGSPIVALLRLKKQNVTRVTGADAVKPLCQMAALNNRSTFFIGPTERVLKRSISVLQKDFPSLKVAGNFAPSQNFDPDSEEADQIIDALKNTGATLCFIGLGAPKQEIFAWNATRQTEGIAFIPVGAALEFIAREKHRAPVVMQKTGLEWVWRLGMEPKRLGRRYWLSAKLLCTVFVREILLKKN